MSRANLSSLRGRFGYALFLLSIIGLTVLAWRWWQSESEDGPDVYAVWGPQPGDMTPRLSDVEDNVRRYGLDVDLPYRFSTNSLGFRGPEPDGTGPVVLVLGDSFAFGMGVNEGETFADALRDTLRDTLPGVVVHNAALPGYTITDQTEQFADRLAALKADVVLVCHTSSDVKEMARPLSFRRYLAHDDEIPERFDAQVQELIDQAGGEKRAAVERFWTFTETDLLKRTHQPGGPVLAELAQRYIDDAVTLAQAVRAAGSEPVFVLWVEGYGLGGLQVDPLAAALKAAGVKSFRAAGAMTADARGPAAELYLPDDHFSAKGNRITGRQTARFLLESGVLSPR